MIFGFVELTDNADYFTNEKGGTFAARLASDFGGGEDLFVNRGTVHTAGDPKTQEVTRFVNLERFENEGLISLKDGKEGDVFRLSNSVAGTDLAYVASGDARLGVDSFLGGPGSTSDQLIIDGNVSGKTGVVVNNTNPGPGVYNPVGIPVVFVNGSTPSDAFFLNNGPIDTGFFDYDLFFRPTGSGVFELKSFPGAGAHLLPQLLTASQDIWHATTETWFDRSTDLRVLLNGGGAAGITTMPGHKLGYDGISFTPAVWIRGSGNWREQEDSARTSAFGRRYRFDLERDLDIWNVQMGLDVGKRALLSPDDALVLGVLGGFTHAELDYDKIAREFDFEGGEVGAYATYLKGGLFVDTLVKVDFLELETATLGFPGSLDATNVGMRVDSGYRFGSYRGGVFLEPLATLAAVWSDLDGFTKSGNRVRFEEEENVRGRLGLRLGSTYSVWNGATLEPFVIGSVWGNLAGDDNQARLTSTGTSFVFTDDLTDVWGEVSGGLNLFSASGRTSGFAKIDVSFGDDLTGVGGKLGVRTKW